MAGMSRGETQDVHQTLLVERFSERLGFDRLAGAGTGDRDHGPYLLLAMAVVLSYAFRFPLLLTEPWRFSTSAAVVGGVVLGLVGARYMRDGYRDAVDRLRLEERPEDHDPRTFDTIVSQRVQLGIYAVAVVLSYYNIITNLDILIAEAGFWPIAVRFLIAAPLAYLPVVIDVGTMFLGVHFLLPLRIAAADLKLFFYDPRNMGGFAPIGQLLKRSYYVYTGGLLAYFAFIYIPIIFSGVIESSYETGLLTAVFFTLAWLAGVVSIGYSMWTVHRLMAEKKEARLRELEDDLLGAIDNPYRIRESQVADEGELDEVTRRLEHVRNMKEYPTTFAMWSQILVSVLLPQALNMAVQVAG